MQVFLHYSWDSEPHKAWVLELANRLTCDGVDLCFDRYDLLAGSNINHFMERIENCEKVIFIMSSGYKAKADNRSGGVGYEYQIISSEIAADLITNKKFIPVLRDGDVKTAIPMLLRSFVHHDMREDKLFEQKYLELLHLLYDEPLIVKPKLGRRPILGARINNGKLHAGQDNLQTVKKVHDLVANSLYQLMAEIEAEGELNRAMMLDKIEELYTRSRDQTYDPTVFTDPPFHDTISKLLTSSANEQLRISLIGNNVDIWEGIDKDKQYKIRTIVQEITDNMKNHSHATEVVWRFERLGKHITILYNDNGVGIRNYRSDDDRSSRKKGLQIIGTLLSAIGGKLDIGNAMREGLRIEITFPVDAEHLVDRHKYSNTEVPSVISHDFTAYDITIIKLLSEGVQQKDIPQILISQNMQPAGLSSIEKRLNIIKMAYNLPGNAQLVAFCKDLGII